MKFTRRRRRARKAATVKDDGICLGKKAPRSKGMGLRIMDHRAQKIGAVVVVKKRAEGGTEVVCMVQISEERQSIPKNL